MAGCSFPECFRDSSDCTKVVLVDSHIVHSCFAVHSEQHIVVAATVVDRVAVAVDSRPARTSSSHETEAELVLGDCCST